MITCYKRLDLSDMSAREKYYWYSHVARFEKHYGGSYPFPWRTEY